MAAPVSSFIYDAIKPGLGVSATISGVTILTGQWSGTNALTTSGTSYYWVLISNNYVPAENHVYLSAWSGAICSGTSYTAPSLTALGTLAQAVGARVLNINTTSHQAEYQADSTTWTGIGATQGTAHAFGIFQWSGNCASAILVTYNSLAGFPVTFNGTNLTLAPTSAGVFAGTDYFS
jgi:hypothetical protein